MKNHLIPCLVTALTTALICGSLWNLYRYSQPHCTLQNKLGNTGYAFCHDRRNDHVYELSRDFELRSVQGE